MNILADANIAYVASAFAGLGDVRTVPAAQITPDAVRDVDLLLTRSTVKHNRALLETSRARFVATATSGVDHVDQEYLRQRNIGFASAHGSNARSVAEWFVAALLHLLRPQKRSPEGLCVGIVGVGKVGTEVDEVCRALGCKVLWCDPPRAQREPDTTFHTLDEVLASCDVLTLHTPLERSGPHPTFHRIGARELQRLRPGALVLNASRGPVIHGDALLEAMARQHISAAALDVWEHEPDVLPRHVQAIDLVSPHIAGHSLDAKLSGTAMIYRAACEYLGLEPVWNPSQEVGPPSCAHALDAHNKTIAEVVLEAVETRYTLRDDDRALRSMLDLPTGARGKKFRAFRSNYRVRREFWTTPLRVHRASKPLLQTLRALRFDVQT